MTIWLWGSLVLACLVAFLELVARSGVIEVGEIDCPLDSPVQPSDQNDAPNKGQHEP
jgi:hypothetical protein